METPLNTPTEPANEPEPAPELGVPAPGIKVGDLSGAPSESPQQAPPVKQAKYLDWAGVNLATMVLYMMAGFVILMLVFAFVSERQASALLETAFAKFVQTPGDSASFKLASEQLTAHQQAGREYLQEITRTVLLNVLLPVLTALLGYVFGKQSTGTSGSASS